MNEVRKLGLFRRLTSNLFEDVTVPAGPEAEPDAALADEGADMPEPAMPSPAMPSPTTPSPAMPASVTAQSPSQPPRAQTAIEEQTRIAEATAAFQARLNRVMQEPTKAVAGKLQLLDLDDVREKLGDRWENAARKARIIAEQVIARRLAPSDVVAPYDDNSFVVLFAELSEEQARMKASAIAREVRDRLLGELGMVDRNWVRAFVTTLENIPRATSDDPKPLTLIELDSMLLAGEDVAPPMSRSAAEVELQRRVGEVGVSYRPTWFVARGVVSLFDCRAQRLDSLNQIHLGASAYARVDGAVTFEIDRSILKRALKDVKALIASDARAVILVPIHVQSLAAHSGGQLVDLCRALPDVLRRFIVIELAGAGHPAMLARLPDLVPQVTPFCRAVSARVPVAFTEFERVARHGVTSVTIDLDEPDSGHIGGIEPQLRAFAARAQTLNLQCNLFGVSKAALVKTAREMGFAYVNGPVVTAEVGRPSGMRSFSWAGA